MTPRPLPSDAASAFVSSSRYLRFVADILGAFGKIEWEVVDYERGYSSVTVYSWPRPAHVEMRFDIGETTAKRRESISFLVATYLANDAFGLPFMYFWEEQYPTVLRPAEREDYLREVARDVAADFRARLEADAGYVRGIDALLDLLASPAVAKESRERREQYATGRILEGWREFRRLGWTEEAILAEVRARLAEESG